MRIIGLERIEVERLRQRVGRLFAALQEAVEDVAPAQPGAWLPPVDLCESREAVVIRVELPGVRAAEIELTLAGAYLRVTGTKKRRATRGPISHLCSERDYGIFRRTVPLHWPVRAQDATAELRDGVLTVQLPKLLERRGAELKVEVKENDGGEAHNNS